MRIESDCLFINRAAELEAACQHLVRMNAPSLPMWRAAADREMAIITVNSPVAPWPAATLERLSGRPTVILVCDDPDIGDGVALGPDAWACARRIRYWARAVMAHGAAGEPDHYREAVLAAKITGRLALIETSSTQAPVWAQFLGCPRTLTILPVNGGVHPLPLERRVMQ